MSSDRDHHTVNFNYGVPSLQPLQSVTPTPSPSGVPAPSQFQPYGNGLQPQIHTQQLYHANTLPSKQPVSMPTGYNQYTPLISSSHSQTYATGSQHSPLSSASEPSSNYNYQPYRRENEFTHPMPLQTTTTTTTGQYDSYQTISPADEQRFQNERMAFNRTNSALSFSSNSSQGQYQQPVADLPPRNLSIQEGFHNQRAFSLQPYENQVAYNNRNTAWNLNQQNALMPQGNNNGNSNGAMAYDYSRDSRFQSSPEYYKQQQYPYPYNSMSLPPQQYYSPMYQGYPPGYGPNVGYFSMAAQSGPIPASKPKVSIDEKTGEELITFSYSKQKVIREFTIRVPTDHFDTSTLSDQFKKDNCVYPKAVVSKDQYKGNRYKYETECNDIGWTLSWFNEEIRDHRGLIQRAVDSWRNTRPDKSIRSRRARRDQDI